MINADKKKEMKNLSEMLLETRGLTKRYGHHKAVDSVSMHIKKGAIYGFIGRNGAGKTTCLKMISGLSRPTSGEIEIFGYKGKDIAGTYTLDTDSGMMTITLLKTPATIRAQVSVSGDTLSMAFEADRLISALKSLTDLAAGINSQAALIGSLVENYDGLWLGFELQRQ